MPQEDNVFQGHTFKMQSPGQCCLGTLLRSWGERGLTGGRDAPPSGKMPTWRRGKHSISIGRTTEILEQEARDNIYVQSSKVNHWSFGEYYCTVVAWRHAFLWSGKWGLKASTISAASSTLRRPVEQWRAGSSALRLHFDVGFCCWLLMWGALLSWPWLTSALWLNTDMDSVTTTCIGFVVLPPGLTSCFGNEFPQSIVILSVPS